MRLAVECRRPVSSTKAIVLAVLFTGLSAAIGVSTALYVGYRKTQEKLNVDGATLRQIVTTAANLDETLHNIAADDEGEFGKRAVVLRERHPFTPPADGRLTERQLHQFIAVKRRLLGIDDEMAADARKEPSGEPGAGFILKWNFFSRANRLRTAQIEALEEQQMPLDEYSWVHLQVYLALVSDGMKTDEMQKAIERSVHEVERQLDDPTSPAAARAKMQDVRATVAEGRKMLTDTEHAVPGSLQSVPAENKELVTRYREDLSRVFLAAIDLDTIDIMRGIETAKAK